MHVDLSGEWEVDDGSAKYSTTLIQEQNHVIGRYDFPAGHHGHIDGFVQGNVFTFRWDQPSNQRAGDGKLILAADNRTMSGIWTYDPEAYNCGVTGGGNWTFRRQTLEPGFSLFLEQLQTRLAGRNYLQVAGVPPISRAFLKPAHGLHDTRVLAVVEARKMTQPPSRIFEMVEDWFQRAAGGIRGEGLLLFVCSRPAAVLVEEIKRSHFYAGNIPVTPAAYDLASGSYWPAYAGWEEEVLGS